MTTPEHIPNPGILSRRANRILYGSFVLLALYFLLTSRPSDSMINLGIALIFDPFDQSVRWDLRPRWQRGWLLAHLIGMGGLFLVQWKMF